MSILSYNPGEIPTKPAPTAGEVVEFFVTKGYSCQDLTLDTNVIESDL